METCRLTAPFGEVLLEVAAIGDASIAPEVRYSDVIPLLPEGMRVDACQQVVCTVTPLPRRDLAIRMRFTLAPNFTAGRASGQWLDAFEIEGPQIAGAIGMRDPDWFADQRGIASVEVDAESSDRYALILRSSGARSLNIGVATAWTLNPHDEQLRNSPWFAVDLALPS